MILFSLGQSPTESGHLIVVCIASLLYSCLSIVNMNETEVALLTYTYTSMFLARAWMNSALSMPSLSE